jgi:hypothetical protein
MVVVAVVVASAEWLRNPSVVPVATVVLGFVTGLAFLYPMAGWRRRGLVAALLGLSFTLCVVQWRLTAIETRWPEQRERRVQTASERLSGDLHAALHRADRLAEAAVATGGEDRGQAFRTLERLVPSVGTEMSVAVLDSAGAPWAWAGRHRLAPQAEGDSIDARATGYYVVLEARRHSSGGRTAVASVLIWAHPAVPDRARSLAERFREETEVGLAVYPRGTAPDSGDVFDYEEPPRRVPGCSSASGRFRRSRAPPNSSRSSGEAGRSPGWSCSSWPRP